MDPLDPKTGFLSSEFIATLGGSIAALAVSVGVLFKISPDDQQAMSDAIVKGVIALGAIAGAFYTISRYIKGRTAVKVEAMRQSSAQLPMRLEMMRMRIGLPAAFAVAAHQPSKEEVTRALGAMYPKFNTGVPVYKGEPQALIQDDTNIVGAYSGYPGPEGQLPGTTRR